MTFIPAPEQVTRRGAGELPTSSAPIGIEMMTDVTGASVPDQALVSDGAPADLHPSGFDPSRMDWRDRAKCPEHGRAVLAEYYPWNDPSRPIAYQVVWWWDGEYREYPQTDGKAYVKRWADIGCDVGATA